MSEKTIIIISSDSITTEKIGEAIGMHLRGGECIELVSDVGGGKTTFVRGLARGAGSLDAVSSPTFTVAQQYLGNKIVLYHYDFYRLQEPGLIAEELLEGLENPQGVTVIEWAESVRKVLPTDTIKITFHKFADEAETRRIEIFIPQTYSYLQDIGL